MLLLKKSDRMTMADLKRETGLTQMAVRQHILALENKGVVAHRSLKNGVGRPMYIYSLTDKALDMFPRSYSKFSLDILRLLEAEHGKMASINLLLKRAEETKSALARVCHAQCELHDRIERYLAHVNSEGSMAETLHMDGRQNIEIYNCVLSDVAHRYPEICTMELDTMRELFGPDTRLDYHIADGAASCRFSVPAKA